MDSLGLAITFSSKNSITPPSSNIPGIFRLKIRPLFSHCRMLYRVTKSNYITIDVFHYYSLYAHTARLRTIVLLNFENRATENSDHYMLSVIAHRWTHTSAIIIYMRSESDVSLQRGFRKAPGNFSLRQFMCGRMLRHIRQLCFAQINFSRRFEGNCLSVEFRKQLRISAALNFPL